MRAIVLSHLPEEFDEAQVRELLAPYGGVGTVVNAAMPDGGKVFAASLSDPAQQERAVRDLNGKVIGDSTLRARALPTGEAYAVFLLAPPENGK
jgi:hypothetical protein